jgi:hypothetical protein
MRKGVLAKPTTHQHFIASNKLLDSSDVGWNRPPY